MAFGTQDEPDEVMNEINMTPLVDVMLVLLIIFMITIPVMKHAVNIDLPQATNRPQDVKPQTLRLSVDSTGAYHWNEGPVSDTALPALLREAAAQNPQPELHLRADHSVAYRAVAETLADASKAALSKVGFVTEPKAR